MWPGGHPAAQTEGQAAAVGLRPEEVDALRSEHSAALAASAARLAAIQTRHEHQMATEAAAHHSHLERTRIEMDSLRQAAQKAESSLAELRAKLEQQTRAAASASADLSTQLHLASLDASQAQRALEDAVASNAKLTQKLQEAELDVAKAKRQRAKVAAQESRVIQAGIHVKSVEEQLRGAEAQLELKVQKVQSDLKLEVKAHKRTRAMVSRLTAASEALKLSHAEATEAVAKEKARSLRHKQRVEALEEQLKVSKATVAAKQQKLDDSLQKQLEMSYGIKRSVVHEAAADTTARSDSDHSYHHPVQMQDPQSSGTKNGQHVESQVEQVTSREDENSSSSSSASIGYHGLGDARTVTQPRSIDAPGRGKQRAVAAVHGGSSRAAGRGAGNRLFADYEKRQARVHTKRAEEETARRLQEESECTFAPVVAGHSTTGSAAHTTAVDTRGPSPTATGIIAGDAYCEKRDTQTLLAENEIFWRQLQETEHEVCHHVRAVQQVKADSSDTQPLLAEKEVLRHRLQETEEEMQHRLHTVQQEKAEIESALLQLERIQAQEAREEKQRAIAAAVVGQAASDRLYGDAFSRQRVPTPLNRSLYLVCVCVCVCVCPLIFCSHSMKRLRRLPPTWQSPNTEAFFAARSRYCRSCERGRWPERNRSARTARRFPVAIRPTRGHSMIAGSLGLLPNRLCSLRRQ